MSTSSPPGAGADAPVQTQSLRAFATNAEFSPKLVAPPTAYDVAPAYLLDGYRQTSAAVEARIKQVTNPDYEVIATRDINKDVKVALQLAAPIGLGIVRAALISKSLLLMALNPVTLALGVPALLLTGSKVLDDLRRAFTVDPAIRSYVQLAHAAAQRGDLAGAEQHIKDALAVDVDPQNPRNGDLYFQIATIHMQAGQPRKALIALSKASVLFGEKDALVQERDGQKVKLSKRGWTELLAMACIDSFSRDDKGLDEWTEVARDFGASAMARFQRFAELKESGHLFGLLGVDERSAELNRSLLAKVRFFQAKLESRRALTEASRSARLRPALDEGRKLLLSDPLLSNEEKATALLEQAQFYFQATRRPAGVSLEMLEVGLQLVEEAGGILKQSAPARAVYLRAEALAMALQVLPLAVQQGATVQPAQRSELARRLRVLTEDATRTDGIDGADVFRIWAEEQLFKLGDEEAERRAAAHRGLEAARSLGDPVAELHAALRLAFLAKGEDGGRDVRQAAETLSRTSDPVLKAFGAKYLAELPAEQASQPDRLAEAATRFYAAAEDARQRRQSLPFLVQGHAVVHGWREAALVLQCLGAHCALRAGDHAGANQALNKAEASAGAIDSPEAMAVVAAIRAGAIAASGDAKRAEAQLAEAIERFPPASRDNYAAWARNLGGLKPPGEARQDVPGAPGGGRGAGNAPAHGLGAFHVRREALLCAAADAAALLTEAGRPEEGGPITEQAERLRENRFNLAVVGEFSTGKSTFINAFLGEKVLPSAVRPTTAAVNRITYAPAPGATVRLASGARQDVPLDQIGEYITEKKNPANQKGVVGVDIRFPKPILESGITVLDTPGIRSLFQSHSETTFATIPKCDAVILLTSATMAFSASEKEFLEQLKQQLDGKVFLVVNKLDQITPSEGARVIDFARTNAAAVVPGIHVFGVSSYWALVGRLLASGKAEPASYAEDANTGGLVDPPALMEGSRFPAFEEALFGHLIRNKAQLLLESSVRTIGNPLKELVRSTMGELGALDSSLSEVREKAKALQLQARDKRNQIEALFVDATARLEAIEAAFRDEARAEQGPLQEKLRARLDSIPEAQLEGLDVSRELNTRLQEWARLRVEAVAGECGALLQEMAESLNGVSQDLSRAYDKSFATSAPPAFTEIKLDQVKVETNQGTMSMVVGGVAGVAIAVLGPVAAAVAWAGMSFFQEKLRQQKVAAVREKLKADVMAAVSQAVAGIQSSVRERLAELRLGPMARLKEQAEGVVGRYERNAESLVRQRERAETEAAETRAGLKSRLAQLEMVLRVIQERN